MKTPMYYGLLPLSILLFFAACETQPEKESAKVVVSMIDAPADYKAVYVDVREVLVFNSDEDAWASLGNFEPMVVDLLELTNGKSALLGEIFLPEGNLSQIRLILGENNSLVTDTDSVKLSTPSAQQSGLKLNINQPVFAGVTYHLVLDFDVCKSVVETGKSGKYILKPVIRAEMDVLTGAIHGAVNPAENKTLILAINGSDTISTYTGNDGGFMFKAMPSGIYDIKAISNSKLKSAYKTIDDVLVSVGKITLLETITLEYTNR